MHSTGTIWRPPYEANSLLPEVTAGCTHHRCKFCTLYADLPFRFRCSPLKDIESDLLETQMLCKNPVSMAYAEIFNQLRPFMIGPNMLTVYPDSALYAEIQQGNRAEEDELEKYRELHILVKHLEIPTYFAAMGASNAVQLRGKLPRDKKSLLSALERILSEVREEDLRHYRRTLPHL